MKLQLIILLALFFSCQSKTTGWRTLDYGAFQLKAPNDWRRFTEQGIDSYVGGLTNGKDSLWFDYGLYGVDISGEEPMHHKTAKDTVNGLLATITIPTAAGKGYMVMRIPKVAEENQFTIWGNNIDSSDLVLRVFKTIVFKSSDTTVNPPLSEGKFLYNPKGSGRTLFQQNCASCHSIFKELTGPPLHAVVEKRNSEWIFQFLTKREVVAKDSAYLTLRKQYGFDCMEFPELSQQDVEAIVDYVIYR